jgi:hypothetical protein
MVTSPLGSEARASHPKRARGALPPTGRSAALFMHGVAGVQQADAAGDGDPRGVDGEGERHDEVVVAESGLDGEGHLLVRPQAVSRQAGLLPEGLALG